MKRYLYILWIFLLPCYAIARCNTDTIVFGHETGFGISFGSKGLKTDFSESMSINVPFSINGEDACFRKKSQMKLHAKNTKDVNKGSVTISPMTVEYENVPAPHEKQYVFVEKNADKTQTKFHVMSFICSDELPLSVEATSDSYINLYLNSNKMEAHVSSTFATGEAAKHLTRKKPLATRETFDFFAKLYKEKTTKEVESKPCCSHKLPSIFSDTSIKILGGIERAIASSFSTLGSETPNGCANDFAKTMSPYLLENYQLNDSLKDYKVSKKLFSNDLVFKWK